MAGFSVANNEHLIRSNLWSSDLKEVFEDELFATRYVDWITDFPDGTTLNIPSVGQAEVLDYDEGQAIRYTAMDTGNFTFTINKYKSSATYVYRKMMQDSFYMNRVISEFVPKQARAIAKVMEVDMLRTGPEAQTASATNAINGASHRWIASGTSEVLVPQDFAKVRYGMQKANVPMTNLIAIIDPSAEYNLSTMTNLVNLSNNKSWEGIVREGASTGMEFRFNIFGFDVYTSQNLKALAGSETIGSTTSTVGVCNLFFSADSSALPIIGAVRQSPKVDSEFNKDLQREEYVTTCRYDFKLYRPENMFVVISDTDQVV